VLFFYCCTQIQCNTVHALRQGGICWFLTRDTTVQFLGSIKRGTGLYLSLSVQNPIPTKIQPIFQLVQTCPLVAQLVEGVHCKLECHGFNSQWCHWNISLT
jgi:hypothetical protein